MFIKKGSSRIEKVIGRVRTDIVELEMGIGEVSTEISNNHKQVDDKREELFSLEREIAEKNKTLDAAKNMATSVKDSLEKLLGTK